MIELVDPATDAMVATNSTPIRLERSGTMSDSSAGPAGPVSPDVESAFSNDSEPAPAASSVNFVGNGKGNGTAGVVPDAAAAGGTFLPPKTEKPRPHRCDTCYRSFARLEHLKRHERSHTKEKPFECPQCTRCFARRDLLLRHQQKLHLNAAPSSRPRNRRESTSNANANRVRKNSVAGGPSSQPGTASSSMRPRANTISHIDGQAIQLLAASAAAGAGASPGAAGASGRSVNYHPGHVRHPSLGGLPHSGFEHAFPGMAAALGHRGMSHGLPKLDTSSLGPLGPLDFASLHTAPAPLGFDFEFDFDAFLFGGSASTINPNALHYNDSPQSMALDAVSPFPAHMTDVNAQAIDDTFDFLSGFDHQMSIGGGPDHPVDGSSPSAFSSASQSGLSDVMLDGSAHQGGSVTACSSMWSSATSAMGPAHLPSSFGLDLGGSFSDLLSGVPLSPQISAQKSEPYFNTPTSSLSSLSPLVVP